jgi:hypothetical protein
MGSTSHYSFWYGLYSEHRRTIEALIRRCPNGLKAGIKNLNDADVITSQSDFLTLQSPLSVSDARLPILEDYRAHKNILFGMYDLGSNPNLGIATNFLLDVLRSLGDIQVDEMADDYVAIENRNVVGQHLRRERDPELAKRRKKRDGYRCQICKMTFEEGYGDIGRSFAEAHHIIPLSKLDGPTIRRIEDLITVCANCHRMLHRLSGEKKDVDELTKRYTLGINNMRRPSS